MELIKINAAEYGLEESKAQEISAMFKPMLDKMVELEKEFNKIAAKDINEAVGYEAKQLRLQYRDVRTGTAEIHKGLKAFYLRGGRFVDSWKNAQLAASGEMEEKLSAIENHFENLQKAKIAKLQAERSEQITKYIDVIPETLGLMNKDVWDNFFTGTKANYKLQKEAEKKVERQRIEKEKKARDEKKRIIAENEKLRLEAIEREKAEIEKEKERQRIANLEAKKREKEAEQRARAETERLKKENEAKRLSEEKERQIRAENEAKLQKEREQRERVEKEAKAKQEQLEDELRKKAEAEAKRLQAIEDAQQAELNMSDAHKVKNLIVDLKLITSKYQFQSEKNVKMYADVGILIHKVINHIEK